MRALSAPARPLLASTPRLRRATRGRGIPVSDATPEPVLLVEDMGPVRRLTMNRPGALNALNHDLTSAISAAVREAGADDGVSVVILRGAGRAFCSGYDLNEDADEGEL